MYLDECEWCESTNDVLVTCHISVCSVLLLLVGEGGVEWRLVR